MSKAGATNIYWECHLQRLVVGGKKRNVLSEESGKQRRMGRGEEKPQKAEKSYNEMCNKKKERTRNEYDGD